MALIGQGVNPVAIDYSAIGNDAWRAAASNVSAISGVIDAVKDRRDKKDAIKTSKELAKAMATLYPEAASALDPVIAELDNEEAPLSQRAALGSQIGSLIEMGVQKSRDAAQMALANRGMAIQEGQFDIDKAAAERESNLIAKAMEEKEALTGFMARPALEQALRETVAAEQRGETPLIGSERLKSAFLKKPEEQIQIVAAAMQGLPKAAPLEFRDVEFTRDGQPTKGTAVFDPKKGQFTLVPIAEAGVAAPTGDLLGFIKSKEGFYAEPYDDYAQTSIGYGTRAKPGETSITKEEAERRLQQEVAQARKGVDRAVAEAGLSLSSQQLDALTSFNYNTGAVDTLLKGGARTPEEIASAMLLYNKAGGKTLPGLVQRRKEESAMFAGGIQPGAAKSQAGAQTPAQIRKEELEIQRLEGEVAGQGAAARKEEDLKKGAALNAEETIQLTYDLEKHPGFEAAIGQGLGKAMNALPLVGDWVAPETGTDRKGALAIVDQLKGRTFLDKIQQMRGMGPLSDAEGARVQAAAARLDPNQSEEDFKKGLEELRQGLRKLTTANQKEASGAPPAASATDRLRAAKAALGQ